MTNLLAAKSLSRSFGGLHVTRHVSFHLEHGARVALIGPNGAGKTTLVNLLTGELALDDGQVSLAGRDITKASIAARVGLGLVRTFQTTRLFTSLSVLENVSLAVMQRQGLTRGFWHAASGFPAVNAECDEILEVLGIADMARRRVAELAYGQQRLIEMAIALALKPKVLLLDEPAAGVPHDEAPRILDAINRLPPGIAVLMIEHDMDLVFRFAQRVLVLAGGQLIFEGTPAEVTADHDVRRAYLGSYADARPAP